MFFIAQFYREDILLYFKLMLALWATSDRFDTQKHHIRNATRHTYRAHYNNG